MTPVKLWALCEFYDQDLAKRGILPTEFVKEQYDFIPPTAEGHRCRYSFLAHCRWMMQECLTRFKPEYEAAIATPVDYPYTAERVRAQTHRSMEPMLKAMRWMAYVQGVLNVYGLFSCSELRAHSREGKEKSVGTQLLSPPRPVEGELYDTREPLRKSLSKEPVRFPELVLENDLPVRPVFPPRPTEDTCSDDGTPK